MKRLLASLTLAASSLLLYPLTINPDLAERCKDPNFRFRTAFHGGPTVEDRRVDRGERRADQDGRCQLCTKTLPKDIERRK